MTITFPLLFLAAVSFLTLVGCFSAPIQTNVRETTGGARQNNLNSELQRLLNETNVPALAAAVIKNGQVISIGAVGIRKSRNPTPVELNDKFHLGSCAKSMTATLAAILVEERQLRWDTTLADVFKDFEIHPEFRRATLTQLLSHNAGFTSSNSQSPLWRELRVSKENGRAQRIKLAKARLRDKPSFTPGNGFIYSNAGYAIAGAMLEKVTGRTWEDLMRTKIFRPLGMTTAGFRAPALNNDTVDQPWGHRKNSTPVRPVPYGDSPDAIGPAGTIHCSIGDWAKYVLYHVNGNPRPLLKSASSLARLHQVHNRKGNYALGWRVGSDARHGPILSHGGSNNMWRASVWMVPRLRSAVIVACNAGTPEGAALCAKTSSLLKKGL